MKMKMKLCLALATCCLASTSIVTYANPTTITSESISTHLSPVAPTETSEEDILTYGKKPPSSSASKHDLSINDYNFQVEYMGANLYTDKFLTGAKSMQIWIQDFEPYDEPYNPSRSLEIFLCNSKGELIDKTDRLDFSNTRYKGVTFSNLTSSKKYYLRFETPQTGNFYSFNGSVEKKS